MMLNAFRRKGWKRLLPTMLSALLAAGSFSVAAAPRQALADGPVPGGIEKSPVLWLKADDAAADDDGKLTGWEDQSGINTFELSVPEGQEDTRTPIVKASGINFNPAVTFNNPNAANHWNNSGKLIGDNEIEIVSGYIVYHWNHNNRLGTIVGSTTLYSGDKYGRSFFSGYSQGGGAYRLTVNAGDSNDRKIGEAQMRNDTQFRIANYNFRCDYGTETNAVNNSGTCPSGEDTAFIDGENKGVYNARNKINLPFTVTPAIGATAGSNSNNTYGFRGDVAEIIFYDEYTDDVDRQKIESYLAVKYGVTLNNGASDYLNTNGDAVWEADATYKYNIAGIGRDDATALHQKQSQSINQNSEGSMVQVAIGLGELAETNAGNENELDDLQYLVWADNGLEMKFNNDINGTDEKYHAARIWKVQNTNGVGEVQLAIPADGLDAETTLLISGTDASFNIADEVELESITLNGKSYYAAKVTLEDGDYFTFSAPAPNPVSAVIGETAAGKKVTITFDREVAFDGEPSSVGFSLSVDGIPVDVEWDDEDFEVDVSDAKKLIVMLPGSIEAAEVAINNDGSGSLTGVNTVPVNAFEIDAAKYIAVTSPEDGDTVTVKKPLIEGTATESVDSVEVVIKDADGDEVPGAGGQADLADGEWSFTPGVDLADGSYTIEVIAKDAGDEELDRVSIDITVDAPEEPAVDKSALQAEVDAAEDLNESDYTAESWSAYAAELAKAQGVLENPEATQEQVNEALAKLQAARNALVEISDESAPEAESAAIDAEEDKLIINFDLPVKLTANNSATGFTVTVNGQAVSVTASVYGELNNQVHLQLPDDVDLAEDSLVTIHYDGKSGNLQGIGEAGKPVGSFEFTIGQAPVVDKSALIAEINLSETLNENDYTSDSWNAYQQALKKAKDVRDDSQATQLEVNSALTDLQQARDGLVRRSSGGAPFIPWPQPRTEIIEVDVIIGGDEEADITRIPIGRTTGTDGKIGDHVTFTTEKAQEAVDKALKTGKNIARVVIPDEEDKVSEVNVDIPLETAQKLQENGIDLEIYTENALVRVPNTSLAGIEEDFYFRLVPVKDKDERAEIEKRAKTEAVVRVVAGDNEIEVVARPMTIETNLSSRPVTLVLPLKDVELPENPAERAAFLAGLGIFIEHSDGEKEVVRGKVVTYNGGLLGLEFTVNKFSTFTIINFNDHEPGSHISYIVGYPDGEFKPDENVTRAQLALMIARNLGYSNQAATSGVPFEDVPSAHYALNAIAFVKERGIMQGDPDGSFRADDSITRAEMAAVVSNYLKLSPAEGSAEQFSDTNGHWAHAIINAAYASGAIQGYPDGSFRPDRNLTRAEAVTLINHMFNRGPLHGVERDVFPDVHDSHWAYGHILEAALDHEYVIDPDQKEQYVN